MQYDSSNCMLCLLHLHCTVCMHLQGVTLQLCPLSHVRTTGLLQVSGFFMLLRVGGSICLFPF